MRHYKVAAGWTAEKAARLKPNVRLLERSPLSSVIELEGLRLGVLGKASAWQLLRVLADSEPRLQVAELEQLRNRSGQGGLAA